MLSWFGWFHPGMLFGSPSSLARLLEGAAFLGLHLSTPVPCCHRRAAVPNVVMRKTLKEVPLKDPARHHCVHFLCAKWTFFLCFPFSPCPEWIFSQDAFLSSCGLLSVICFPEHGVCCLARGLAATGLVRSLPCKGVGV